MPQIATFVLYKLRLRKAFANRCLVGPDFTCPTVWAYYSIWGIRVVAVTMVGERARSDDLYFCTDDSLIGDDLPALPSRNRHRFSRFVRCGQSIRSEPSCFFHLFHFYSFAVYSPMIAFGVMARRPPPPDQVLSRAELQELQRRLAMMRVTAVQDFYRAAHDRCRLDYGRLPSARQVQEFVTVWKQLRKWR